MRSVRGRLLATAAIVGALAIAVPVSAANAEITPIGGFPIGGGGVASTPGCTGGPVFGTVGASAGPGGEPSQNACGAILAFNGPVVGNVSSTIGPTIIGATILAPVTVSTGGPVISSIP
jgi:hypothetical protein